MVGHEEIYLDTYREKNELSYAVYYGHQDPRNVTQRCNSIVVSHEGAELEALVHILETVSAQPGHDRQRRPYIVKTSSVEILSWILIHIPACKTYGWIHPEPGKSLVYEPILRYIDSLLVYLRVDGTPIVFSFVPPQASWPAAARLTKTAPEIVLRDWDTLCYNTWVQVVHAVTRPGSSPSTDQTDEAFRALSDAQARMVRNQATLDSNVKDRRDTERKQATIPAKTIPTKPVEQPTTIGTGSKVVAAAMHSPPLSSPPLIAATIRSSQKWTELIKSGNGWLPGGYSARIYAELCEDVIPDFGLGNNNVHWPLITKEMRTGVENRLKSLQESWKALHASSNDEVGNSPPSKKRKISGGLSQTSQRFLDEFVVSVTSITRRLRAQILGEAEPLALIVVFRDDNDKRKYTVIDHLPHLVAAANKSSKKKVKLVTFPKSSSAGFLEMFRLDLKGIGPLGERECEFGLEKKTYAHDEELVKLLKTVPTVRVEDT